MEPIIRSATSSDLSDIRELIKSVDGDERKIDFVQFIIAEQENRVVGCIRTVQVEADCKEIASFVVLPEYRKKGIGRMLLIKILEFDSHRPLYIICKNYKQAYYEKNGFLLSSVSDLPMTLKRDYLEMNKTNNDWVVMSVRS